MQITLKNLTLTNFKGARSLSVDFGKVTNIHGDNGTGKSTIFDAFTWLLFGKDSHDCKDFNIKTLDADGAAIPMIDHTVIGILDIDGSEVTLKRTYQEKWTRRRGSDKSELTGHETLYYINEAPASAGEYKSRVDGIVSEGLFKLLTSSLYFSSLKWQERRQILVKMAGEIKDADVLKKLDKGQVADVNAILKSGKALEDARREIAAKKKKLLDDLSLIPSRVDECRRGIPQDQDFAAIAGQIGELEMDIRTIEDAIADKVHTHEQALKGVEQVQNEIHQLRKDIADRQHKAEMDTMAKNMAVTSANALRSELKLSISAVQRNIDTLRTEKEALIAKIATLREQWTQVSMSEPEMGKVITECPTCHRTLDQDTILSKQSEIRSLFDKSKNANLDRITSEGKALSSQMNDIEREIKERTADLQEFTAKLEGVIIPALHPVTPADVSDIQNQIDTLSLKILDVPVIDIQGLKEQKDSAQKRIYELKALLGHQEVIERGNARVAELMKEEKSLSSQVSELERYEFSIESFIRGKMDMVEQKVNGRFSIVTFRLFNKLINGAMEECCDCIVRGVPYADANSAGKIQGGIDIINTLSEHYGITAPVFIDNRESTNVIPDTKAQVVNLVVTKDKTLKIN